MNRILNFGSLNIDYVYQVDHFVRPGETETSIGLSLFPGGKGLNQSVALAKAGGAVYHAGKIGQDGEHLVEFMKQSGVNADLIDCSGSHTGQAIIQVNREGQNCILLHHGANFEIGCDYIDDIFKLFDEDDILLIQNEISRIDYIIHCAWEKKMKIIFNPSPICSEMKKFPLDKITYFIMNEIEGCELTGEMEPEKIIRKMAELYPKAKVVLTIGKNGVIYHDGSKTCSHGIYKVPVIDTTAAGDTFTGFFVGSVVSGKPAQEALRIASVASSIAVSRQGAAVSIPDLKEVLASDLEPMPAPAAE